MSLSLFVSPKWSFQDDTGGNASGWKLYTYEPGTSTPKVAYQDSAGTTPHANPIVLDARGEAEIWLDGAYKFILKNTADVTKWTSDNVSGYGSGIQTGYLVKDVAGSANVALTASEQANAVIEFTGLLTGNINVTVGDDKDGFRWAVVNNTTGSFTLTLKTTAGSGPVIPRGAEAHVYHDGADIVHDTDAQLDGLGGSTVGKAVFTAADEGAAQSALGLGSAAVADILGAVSQSGGVPTGAIIERGSNANGEYVRFADGTQICTGTVTFTDVATAVGAIYAASAAETWTFPANFSASAQVYGSDNSSANIWISCARGTASSAVRPFGYQSIGTARTIGLTAIGRWF